MVSSLKRLEWTKKENMWWALKQLNPCLLNRKTSNTVILLQTVGKCSLTILSSHKSFTNSGIACIWCIWYFGRFVCFQFVVMMVKRREESEDLYFVIELSVSSGHHSGMNVNEWRCVVRGVTQSSKSMSTSWTLATSANASRRYWVFRSPGPEDARRPC